VRVENRQIRPAHHAKIDRIEGLHHEKSRQLMHHPQAHMEETGAQAGQYAGASGGGGRDSTLAGIVMPIFAAAEGLTTT
jgi:hypothetical protein